MLVVIGSKNPSLYTRRTNNKVGVKKLVVKQKYIYTFFQLRCKAF